MILHTECALRLELKEHPSGSSLDKHHGVTPSVNTLVSGVFIFLIIHPHPSPPPFKVPSPPYTRLP